MKNTILLKELTENKIDKAIMNKDLKAGDWGLTFNADESWWFTFTNGDDSTIDGQISWYE